MKNSLNTHIFYVAKSGMDVRVHAGGAWTGEDLGAVQFELVDDDVWESERGFGHLCGCVHLAILPSHLSHLGDAVRWPNLRVTVDVEGPTVTGWAIETIGQSRGAARLMCCGTLSEDLDRG